MPPTPPGITGASSARPATGPAASGCALACTCFWAGASRRCTTPQRCLEICTAHPDQLDDWDVPYAHEALSRAHALVGDDGKAARHRRTAGELAEPVADAQDKEQLERDISTLPHE